MANRIQAYEAIINEFTTMLESLDEYRKEPNADKKRKHLFKTHSHEGKARKLVGNETARQELLNQKDIAA